MKIYYLMTAAALLTSTFAIAAPAVVYPDISGLYDCQWYENGKALPNDQSTLTIVKKQVTFEFSWAYANGLQYLGTGLFNKADTSAIAVGFYNIKQPKENGLQVYQISADGTLTGDEILKGQATEGYEQCTKRPSNTKTSSSLTKKNKY